MSTWQPQQQGLRELVVLLRDAANPYNKEQSLINIVKYSYGFANPSLSRSLKKVNLLSFYCL